MRVSLLLLAGLLAACAPAAPRGPTVVPLPDFPEAAPRPPAPPPVLDPAGGRSPLAPSRDVVVGGTSIVGRWVAVEVVDDPLATADLRRGVLAKTLVVNPTGHAILRGQDAREANGQPAAFSGRVDGDALRLRDLPGAATLRLRGTRLSVLDPGGTTTVYAWRGR